MFISSVIQCAPDWSEIATPDINRRFYSGDFSTRTYIGLTNYSRNPIIGQLLIPGDASLLNTCAQICGIVPRGPPRPEPTRI